MLKDAAGNSVKTYSYDPFGNQDKDTEKLSFQGIWKEETSQVYNPFGYCGEYFDEETGFVYLRGRYYDPATERFITEDPVKDGGNWYAYCGNDPVNRMDPSGYAYTDWDAAHGVSVSIINAATAEWEAAHGNNDAEGMRKAHEKAEKERNKHRKPNERGTAGGHTITLPGTPDNSLANIDWENTPAYQFLHSMGIEIPTSPVIEQQQQSQPSRIPDFYVISIGYGIGSVSYIVDKWQREYLSVGGNEGIPSASASITAYWIDTPDPGKKYVHDYIKDWSGSVSIGAGGGTSIIRPKDLSLPVAKGYGLYTPQISGSAGKTREIPAPNTRPEYARPH